MNEDQMLQIYYTIKKVLYNKRITQYSLVKELTFKYNVELEDLHHDLFCSFIEQHRNKDALYYYNYIKTFCYYRLIDLKKCFQATKRAEDSFHHEQFDDNKNYTCYDPECIYLDLLEEKDR